MGTYLLTSPKITFDKNSLQECQTENTVLSSRSLELQKDNLKYQVI